IVQGPTVTKKRVGMNKGNLMLGDDGSLIPIDPGFLFTLAQVRPGSKFNKAAPWARQNEAGAPTRSPSVQSFCSLGGIAEEGNALFTYLISELSKDEQDKLESSREQFVESFRTGAVDAAKSLLKRQAGWKNHILACGGDDEDVSGARTHR